MDPSHSHSVRSYCLVPDFSKRCQVPAFMRDETKKAFAVKEKATGQEPGEKVEAGRDGERGGERERGGEGRKWKGREERREG